MNQFHGRPNLLSTMSTRPEQDGEVFFLSIPFHPLCYSNVTPSGTRAPKGRRVLAGGLAGIAGAAAGLSRRTEKPVAGQQGPQRPWRHGSVREPGAGGPDEKANHGLDYRGSRRDGAFEGPASQRRIAGVAGPATVGTGPGPDEDVAPGSEGGPRELHGRMAAEERSSFGWTACESSVGEGPSGADHPASCLRPVGW